MTDSTLRSAPRKRRGWLRTLAWVLGVVVVLMVVFYFVATSSAFFKGVILPRVSKSLNADVTVSTASIHPFSHVVLRDLKVQAKGEEPVLTAPEVRARYHLWSIIGGNIRVDEIALVSPNVLVLTKPDGTSNLDPITRALKAKPSEKAKQPSKPAQVDMRDISLTGGTVRLVKEYGGGNRDVTSVSNLNVSLAGVKNGASGKMQLKGDIQVANNPPAPATNGLLIASLNGNFDFSLTPDLAPGSAKGETRIAVTRAEGSFAEFSTLNAVLACDMTPTEIRDAALRFQKGNESLGELRARGPFDAQKMEGNVKVELLSLDKRLLNLFGASSGLDFGPTTISSTNQIQFAKAGSVINAAGQFDIGKLQVTRAGATTPSLDLRANYDVSVDRDTSVATLRKIDISGTQSGRPLLLGRLTSPMNIPWGGGSNQFGNATLPIVVTNLNLADWKPFLRDSVGGGMLNAALDLTSQANGRQLGYSADARIENLSAKIGSNEVTQAGAHLRVRGQATDLKQFRLDELGAEITQQGQTALTASGSGGCDTVAKTASMDVSVQGSLPQLFRVMAQPGLTASSGTLKLTGRLTQKDKAATITGNLALGDFTGKFGEDVFQAYGATIDLDASKTSEQIQIRKASGKLTQGGNAGGSFNIAGTCTPADRNMQLNLTLADFNQNGLRPFLEPMLTRKKLNSIAVNGEVAVHFVHDADSSLKANLQITNLVVSTPGQTPPATPLEARVQTDAAMQKQIAELKQCLVTLTPTPRAKNQLSFTGKVDFSDTNAIQGSLKLTADSLDVTKYYDLFSGETNKTEKDAAATTAPGQSILDLTKEPDAVHLPVKNFTVDANIGKLYLRELEMTDFATTLKLDGGHMLLNPLRFAINGGPVNATADLDLSVSGYRYNLDFKASRIPVAPLANSFAPDYRGRAKGDLNADLNAKGAGITGAGMQKSLTAQVTLVFTNAEIYLMGPRIRKVVLPIVTVLQSPELANSPVNWLVANVNVSAGKINLSQFQTEGTAFGVRTDGSIPIASVVNNSQIPNLPVNFSLARSLTLTGGGNATNTQTNSPFVDLGAVAHVGGTIGDPKTTIDYTRVALVSGQYLGGKGAGILKAIEGIRGGQSSTNSSGGLLNRIEGGVGSILGGGSRSQTNSPNTTTNQPATNQNPVNRLLRGLRGL